MRIDYHVLKEELKSEIEKEFMEVLKNTALDQSENVILFGENFAFRYIGIKRSSKTIQFKFIVYRKWDLLRKKEMNKKQHKLGTISIVIFLPRKREKSEEE